MTVKEIFEHLFSIASRSNDLGGVVTACLVRDSVILVDGVSYNDSRHAEYVLLENIQSNRISVLPGDTVYTTVEPCGHRTPGGLGEKMGDCTTNLIKAGVKHVVYAAADPDASSDTRHKFEQAGCILEQVEDREIIHRAIALFNSTVTGKHEPLPEME